MTRNAFLHDKGGIALPKAQKTGTTICGAVFEGGVVVGADTRATAGDIVADKNCNKVSKKYAKFPITIFILLRMSPGVKKL